jgi:peptidoglycan/LPS O-acetylase OafA/YrhL
MDVVERPNSSENAPYMPGVDGLRAVAALFVVLDHAWRQSWPDAVLAEPGTNSLLRSMTAWLAHGQTAVTAFIVISGFCLMMPLASRRKERLEKGAITFYGRRARRILPPYYIAFFLSLAACVFWLKPVTQTLYDAFFPIDFVGIMSHLFLVQNLSPNQYQINGAMWSIAVEFQIYLLFPLLLWILRKAGMKALLLATFVTSYSVFELARLRGFDDQKPHYLFIFTLGVFAAQLSFGRERAVASRSLLNSLRAFVLIGAMGSGVAHKFVPWGGKEVVDFFVGIATVSLLLILALYPSDFLQRIFGSKLLVVLGAMSYSLYLIHLPIQQLLWQYLVQPLNLSREVNFTLIATAGTAVCIAASYGFFLLFEKPFMNHTHRDQVRADVPHHIAA